MSKKQARTTKWNYPLMRYLSLLLAVTLLFTGVTFARFALYRDTGMGAGIAKFDVSYTIDGVNSLTFGNQSYWQTLAGGWYAQGGSRTVRVGMYNNSDIDAHAHTLTMEGPAEFWENIALQLTTVKEESESETGYAAGEIVTTQYVLADFLRVRYGGETADGSTSDERHNYKYDAYIDWKTQKDANDASDGVFDTVFSDEFGQRGSIEEKFQMSGGISVDETSGNVSGSVTAERQSARDTATEPETSVFSEQDLTITITASMREVQYSVGYVRKEGNTSLPAFYLDCKKEVPYYTIEITLPDNYTESGDGDPYFVLHGKSEADSTVVNGEADSVLVFLTWTNSVSSEDLSSDPDIALTPDALEKVATTKGGEFNGARVIGYHFNYNDVPATQNGQEVETTVRMNKTVGETGIRWEHIASISSGEGAYPHPLIKQENESYRCDGENYVEIAANVLDSEKYNGTFSPSEFETTKLGDTQDDYCVAAEKGYAVRFAVYFEQHSELPAEAGA